MFLVSTWPDKIARWAMWHFIIRIMLCPREHVFFQRICKEQRYYPAPSDWAILVQIVMEDSLPIGPRIRLLSSNCLRVLRINTKPRARIRSIFPTMLSMIFPGSPPGRQVHNSCVLVRYCGIMHGWRLKKLEMLPERQYWHNLWNASHYNKPVN